MGMEMALKEVNNIDKNYLRMAFIEAEKSVAIRLKVGAVIVKNDRIISNGHNQQPNNMSKVCEIVKDDTERIPLEDDDKELEYLKSLPTDSLQSKSTVRHAEISAILKARRKTSCKDATIYVTHQPCVDCAKRIIKAKIKRVVYSLPYRIEDGLELLKKAKIRVDKIECCNF